MKQKIKVINLKEKSRDDLVQLFALNLAENMELKKVIKEVRDYINKGAYNCDGSYILEILNKVGSDKE